MPNARLDRARTSLPVGYRFGDATFTRCADGVHSFRDYESDRCFCQAVTLREMRPDLFQVPRVGL